VGDEFGCAAGPGGDDDELRGHGGGDGGGKGVGERWDDEDVGLGEEVALLRGGDGAGEVYAVRDAVGDGDGAEQGGVRAGACDGDVEGMSAACEDGGGLKQHGQSGVGDERREGEHLHGDGDGARRAGGVEGGVHAGGCEKDAVPCGGRGEAH